MYTVHKTYGVIMFRCRRQCLIWSDADDEEIPTKHHGDQFLYCLKKVTLIGPKYRNVIHFYYTKLHHIFKIDK